MNGRPVNVRKGLSWACMPLLSLALCLPAAAATATSKPSPQPGSYCPGTDILLIVAEELSASLDLVSHSREALINKDRATAVSSLTAAGSTLHLAASRGAAARTILLIDAIRQLNAGEDYEQTLEWFPLLHTSLSTLPNDATVGAAIDLIDNAEGGMQGDQGKDKAVDPMVLLNDARHMLACDGLDIPLQQALRAQEKLVKQLDKNPKETAYDPLLESLRSALAYALGNNKR